LSLTDATGEKQFDFASMLEQPPASLLGMIGAQLKIAPVLWERYAARDQTRRQFNWNSFDDLD
jgi:hypothetical protein